MSKELSERIAKASARASEVYVQNTWLRAAINLIPYIGGSLDVVLASRGSLHQKRIIELLESLKEEMSHIKGERIDSAYLESPEFSDIVLKLMEASLRTRDREKMRLYAKFLRGAVLIQDRSQTLLEDYLATLIELTPNELEVARAIYEQQRDSELEPNESTLQWAWRKGWKDLPNQVTSVSKDDLPFVLLRIEKSGLVKELTGSYVGYEGGVFVVTDTFRKIMRFIDDEKT
jgi:hypothetical protein